MRNPIRSIRNTGVKIVLAGLALVVAVPAVAIAAGPFTDVPDDRWFTDPVDWAFTNDITTGKTPTTFNGQDDVSRYESVTFLNRYDENIVQPAIDTIGADVEALEADTDAETVGGLAANELTRVAGERSETGIDNWDGSASSIQTTITAPTAGFLLVEYVVTFTTDVSETATGTTQLLAELDVGTAEAGRTYGGVDFDAHWRTNFQTLTVSSVVSVEAGDHIVKGTTSNAIALPAGGLMYLYDEGVTALFVPFDGAGLSPA